MNLKEAKVALYHELLLKSPDTITDNEAELGHLLAKDPEIQEILQKAIKRPMVAPTMT